MVGLSVNKDDAGAPSRVAVPRMPVPVLGVVDQVVSSASNLLVGVAVAHDVSPRGFGAFGIAYAVYLAVLTVGRGAVGGVAAFRLTPSAHRSTGPSADGVAFAMWIGIGTGGATAVLAAAFCSHDLRAMLLVLAAFLPALVMQDALRYVAFAANRPWYAIVNDAAWLTVQLVLLGILSATVHPTGAEVLATWGLASIAGVLLGIQVQRLRLGAARARRWFSDHRDTVGSLTLEYALISAVLQGSPLIVGLVAGLPAVGAMRAVQTSFGPVTALSAGLSLAILPRAARAWSTRERRFCQDLVVAGGALTVLAFVWAGLIVWLPLSTGHLILGASWVRGRDLALVTAAYLALGFLALPPTVGLRILGRSWMATRVRAALVPIVIAGVAVGAAMDGAYGASVGLVIGSAISLLPYWALFVNRYRGQTAVRAHRTGSATGE